jgi:hypothetical protein
MNSSYCGLYKEINGLNDFEHEVTVLSSIILPEDTVHFSENNMKSQYTRRFDQSNICTLCSNIQQYLGLLVVGFER